MEMIIKFTDGSQSFVNGVEFGRILQKLQQGEEFASNEMFPVREANRQVLIQACAVYGYIATFGAISDGWVDFVAIKRTSSEN